MDGQDLLVRTILGGFHLERSSVHKILSQTLLRFVQLSLSISLSQVNSATIMSRHPIVKWAQRPDTLFITIDLPDAQDVKLKLEPEGKFLFSATTGKDKIPYEVDLNLYDKIDVNESKASVGLRNICYLVKKAENKWWSRLIKQEGKAPVFLKVDWDKWVDEDEESEAQGPGNDMDFGDLDFSKLNMGDGGDALGDEFDDSSDTEDENIEEAPPATAESDTKHPANVEDEAKPSV